MAIIFNHEEFQSLLTRKGTNIDRDNLMKAMTDLGFEVSVYDNLTAKSIMNVVDQG